MLDLSVIIPAYNEERNLPGTVRGLFLYLGKQLYKSEILIIENGSQDRTRQIAESLVMSSGPKVEIRAISLETNGKGKAIRAGMIEARGRFRMIFDADSSCAPQVIGQLWESMHPWVDVVIASRQASGARRINEPLSRHISGRVFNLLVRALLLPGVQDSQCGYKLFTDTAAAEIFSRQIIDGWAFDVEALVIANRLGYQIIEKGVEWYHYPTPRVRLVRDAYRMTRDILQIKSNRINGLYDKNKGRAIAPLSD